jgi:hypothetical protein
MDISSDFLLGHSTNSLELHAKHSKDEFSQAWSMALSWIPLRAHLGSLMDWIPHPSFFRACKTIHAYSNELDVMAIAAKSQKEDKSRYIFLHALAEEITDPVQLRDHTLSILCAGRDTTAEVLLVQLTSYQSTPVYFRVYGKRSADSKEIGRLSRASKK